MLHALKCGKADKGKKTREKKKKKSKKGNTEDEVEDTAGKQWTVSKVIIFIEIKPINKEWSRLLYKYASFASFSS